MDLSTGHEHLPLGLLGGTFDPIHHGHLRLALEAREALGLDYVRLIPAGQPPHRDQPGCSSHDRLAMTELAARGCTGIEVDATEVHANQPSYTVLTLERIRSELGPLRPLVLIVGIDAFLGMSSWFRWQDLFTLAHIAVATRPGYDLNETAMPSALAREYSLRHKEHAAALTDTPAGRICRFEITGLAISATAIRALFSQGRNPRFLLPDAVLDYIQAHRLYQY